MPTPSISIHLNNLNHFHEIYDNKKFLEDRICLPQPKRQSKTHESKLIKEQYNITLNLDYQKYELPIKLSHINDAIEKSKYILTLDDDWDGDGAIKIPLNTFNRAINFIKDYSTTILTKHSTIIIAPIISPLKDGSIDLLWETKNNSLLLNIKNDSSNNAFYYGVIDINNTQIDFNGNIKTDFFVPVFSDWLKEYQLEN